MSSEKEATDSPTVVFAETTSAASPRKTKKYVIIAVSAVLSAAIVLAAILVGMYFFTEAQKEIVKYSMTFSNNVKQDVTADPNENVVQYHMSTPQQETWIVNDFNKDIQLVKIQTDRETNCYISALNRSAATDPSKVAKPQSSAIKESSSLVYKTSGTPISDTSFLSKKARDMCKGVSVYWVYPQCLDKEHAVTNATDGLSRKKRASSQWGSENVWRPGLDTADVYAREKREAPYYDLWYTNGNVCVGGCCAYICACQIQYYWNVYSDGSIACTWYVYDCNGNPTSYVYAYGCYNGPSGLRCPNRYPATWSQC